MAWLRGALADWPGALEMLQMPATRWGYRTRVALRARYAGGWKIGLQRRRAGERKPEILEIPGCPVHAERVNRAVADLRDALAARGLDDRGFPLAYLVVNGAFLTLVLKCRKDAKWIDGHEWLREWRPEGFEGAWLCFHPSAGNKIFSKDWQRLFGPERARTEDGFWYARDSFLQAIPSLHRESLDVAEAFLRPATGDLVLDLYSGVGISLARWRAQGAECVGVEIGGSAVECSELNAGPGLCLRGDCENRIPQLTERVRAWRARDSGGALLYANPPRTGFEAATLEWTVSEFRPERIAYLSCSAGTLARDLLEFCARGYRVARIIPYDFFPQTSHVESLALLER